ncbi:glycosyltransferase [Streptomyces sp. NPDC007162]|uniref:glycosyltransferase n=1 Tax=Streptomyces sp. NPDC007162 TaxID=3156917 RepID=UPI0033FCF2C1
MKRQEPVLESTEVAASVIIPTYNRADLLRRTLGALSCQRDAAFEVIVVDDGSSDGTREMVAAFASRLPVRYFFQEDLGFRAAAARNLGIREARGDVCVFLDSGVLPTTGLVHHHVALHRAGPERLAVVGYTWAYRASLPLGPETVAAIDPEDADGSAACLAAFPDGRDVRDDFFYSAQGEDLGVQPAPWVTFWACNVSVRREDLFLVGLFDEAYRGWGFEDLDLGYRLFRSGVRFRLSRQAAAVHLPHQRADDDGQRSDHENKLYFHSKFRNHVSELALSTPYNLQINALLKERQVNPPVAP